MFIKKWGLLVTLLLLSSVTSWAQTITGTVLDAQSKDPLPGANIVQQGTHNGVASEKDGTFTIKLIPRGGKQLTVSYVGYKSQTVEVPEKKQKLTILLIPKTVMSSAVQIKGLRVDSKSAVTYDNISQKQIKEQNLGQDIPYLINFTPSVVTTSDAGAGVGYTGIRIRGVDPTRINVTINGIPLNDSESQAVYWVDIPDLASSIQSMQIQRGVGTSTNGAGAFGASINIQTTGIEPSAFGDVNVSYGSFNTQKYDVKVGTGLMKNGWSFDARLSKIHSDGYIDRAFSDLKSMFFTASHYGKRSLLQVNIFPGKEKTYQAWYGVKQSILDTNRTYNPYTYDNQTDNYNQNHYQVLYSYKLKKNWTANIALHYTKGKGYYEEYKKNQLLSDYSLQNVVLPDTVIKRTDLIRRKWLDNDFYGLTYSTNIKHGNVWNLDVGGAYNIYKGQHFGHVIWAKYFSNGNIRHPYYDNNATKKDGNIYAKLTYNLTRKFSAFGDLQMRNVNYNFLGNGIVKRNGKETIVPTQQTANLTFWNPKIGLNYQFDKGHRVYTSFSVGNKEPGRDEYVESTPQSRPKPETLYDWETGYRYESPKMALGLTGYLMDYKDQLILTGQINDVGAYIRQNVPKSYRMGLELQAAFRITNFLQWSGNATFSRNKIDKYKAFVDNYDTGGQKVYTYQNTNIAFSPNMLFNSIFRFSHKNLKVDFMSKYVGKQYLDNTQSESSILKAYFINDLRVNYDIKSVPMVNTLRISFLLNNIFNEMYSSNGYDYSYIYNGQMTTENYYYPQAGRNFLVQLSLNF